MKENCVITFAACELFWEFGRFAPHIIWKRKNQYKNRKDVKFICITQPENFDIYGRYIDIFVPFRLKNNSKYKPNCFRLDNLSQEDYLAILTEFKNQFKDRYNILEFITPNTSKKEYLNKNQFSREQSLYDYLPRKANEELIHKYMNGKPVIILAPRYREGIRRNWPHWNDFYDLIFNNDKLMSKYNFVICGKDPDYIPDYKKRFLDINYMDQNINTSLIGLTMEYMNKAVLTVGSQSAIPNISLLFGVHALEWGHQKHLHTVTYNIRKTKVTFLDDTNYNISPKKIYKEMLNILK